MEYLFAFLICMLFILAFIGVGSCVDILYLGGLVGQLVKGFLEGHR